MSRLFDVTSFIGLAGISRHTLNKWQKLGLLPKRLLGGDGAIYFKQEDLDRVPEIKKIMAKRREQGGIKGVEARKEAKNEKKSLGRKD